MVGVDHFFAHLPLDGKVVFDPEGILSRWPASFSVRAGLAFPRGILKL